MAIDLLYKAMCGFSAKSGERLDAIYYSLIDFIAGYLDWTGHPVLGWKHSKEENMKFQEMMMIAFECISEGIEERGWCDIFGDIFMAYLARKDSLGQCFTPDAMCNVVARDLLSGVDKPQKGPCGSFGEKITISEPSCGSGRLALALGHLIVERFNEYPYIVCEDIDPVCVRQTAINLAVHGMYGEVMCHDTLSEPAHVRFGYIVNEGLYPSREGLPTLRFSENPKHFIGAQRWKSMERKEVKQLSLFD